VRGVEDNFRLTVECLEAKWCSVLFEPYGFELILHAKDQLRLEIGGAGGEALELAYSPGCITIWLPSSVTQVRAWNRLNERIELDLPLRTDSGLLLVTLL
jgi:hypothetical protein